MNNIMSLLAYIFIVWLFVELQFFVEGPGRYFAGESIVRRLRRHSPFFGQNIPYFNFFFILRGGDGGDELGGR